MKNSQINRIHILVISAFVLFLDQLTKYIAVSNQGQERIPIINRFLQYHLVTNQGAAFSLFSKYPSILLIISIIISILLLIYILTKPSFKFTAGLYTAFLFGGTIANGIDRFRLGYVIDFIELVPIDFPIFNIADISINIAVILILYETLSLKISAR